MESGEVKFSSLNKVIWVINIKGATRQCLATVFRNLGGVELKHCEKLSDVGAGVRTVEVEAKSSRGSGKGRVPHNFHTEDSRVLLKKVLGRLSDVFASGTMDEKWDVTLRVD